MNVQGFTLKDYVKNDFHFVKFADGDFHYMCDIGNLEIIIPLSEIGNGTMYSTERGITLLKWIRNHLNLLNQHATVNI